jgi:hypothetical protein
MKMSALQVQLLIDIEIYKKWCRESGPDSYVFKYPQYPMRSPYGPEFDIELERYVIPYVMLI